VGLLLLLPLVFTPKTILIREGMVFDGLGQDPRRVDLRISESKILEIGKLRRRSGEEVIEAKGMFVAPGFIDAHSHAAGGIIKDPGAISQVSQGITTAVCGQDGGWSQSLENEAAEIQAVKPNLNFAFFSGHGGIRAQVMGNGYKRSATKPEIEQMKRLVEADMRWGAIGMSSGLEYDPGYYSTTEELEALAQAVKPFGGMYISHVRDEADRAFSAFDELLRIGKSAKIPAQISHIKLCSSGVWGQSQKALEFIDKHGLTADVYPYLYWQSTMAALTPSRDWSDRKIWEKGLSDVGGPANVRLTRYSKNPSWEGMTLAELEKNLGKDAISLIQEIMKSTENGEGSQSVVVTAMREDDLIQFLKHPRVMFCSDGSIGGSHPRGAGSFPRLFGRYVREKKIMSWKEAIRKATSLPAKTFGLKNRGQIKKGYFADLVIFDPKTILDRATPTNPTALSKGIRDVMVSGKWSLRNGKTADGSGGQILKRDR
jgi:N-acyl-D-amino-acid deacylase